MRTETRIVDIISEFVVVEKGGREEKPVFDTVIPALGLKPYANDETIRRLRAAAAERYVVGDGNNNRGALWNATTSGFDAAMAI